MTSFFVVDGMGPYDLLLISLSSNKIHPCFEVLVSYPKKKKKFIHVA